MIYKHILTLTLTLTLPLIVRRGIWNIFRIEWEVINTSNVEDLISAMKKSSNGEERERERERERDLKIGSNEISKSNGDIEVGVVVGGSKSPNVGNLTGRTSSGSFS